MSSSIRIVYLVDDFPILSQTFVLQQMTGMIERGHSIHIYANRAGNLSKVHSEVERYHLLEKTSHFSMPGPYGVRLARALKWLVSYGWKNPLIVFRALNIFRYGRDAASLRLLYSVKRFFGKPADDVVHCQLGYLGLQGIVFQEIGAVKGKLLVSFRGADLSLYLKMFGPEYYQDLFKKADRFLPVSESMKSQLMEIGCPEDRIIVLHSGIDIDRFAFATRTVQAGENIRLVTIARLVEKKGVEYAIRAVARIVEKFPDIEYLIVGEGPLTDDLQGVIDELQLGSQVKLLGWKDRQEIVQILTHAHILVAPSVTSRDGDSEGIPNVLKEAMAMGIPVLSTRHSGIPELVQDGVSGFLVPERNVDALAEKLEYLMNHPERWADMGRAGRAFVEEHFEINRLNDRLEEIYLEVVDSV